jgi:hypothetical protein
MLHPIDYLRRRRTRGRLQISVDDPEVRRGEALDARVTIADSRLGDVEVGLVCTEFYEVASGGGTGSNRGTSSATAFEAWHPVTGTSSVHNVRLSLPAEAPFSYEGELLCFRWEVVARGRRKRRLDMHAAHEISVLP